MSVVGDASDAGFWPIRCSPKDPGRECSGAVPQFGWIGLPGQSDGLGVAMRDDPQTPIDAGFAEIDGTHLELIEPGEYQLRFDFHETAMMFGRAPKLILWFKVMSFGRHVEKSVPCYYNATRLIGRAGKSGKFRVGRSSAFVRDFARLFPSPTRLDRMPMGRFADRLLIGSVRTVVKGSDQRPLAATVQYSVVDSLIRIEE